MRYEGRFEKGKWSLGHFYGSDVKKLIRYKKAYPFMITDDITNPLKHFRERSRKQDNLFFTVKRGKEILGYAAFDPVGKVNTILHVWKRPGAQLNWEDYRGVLNLLLSYGFGTLKFLKVTSYALAAWPQSALLLRRFGFKHEACLRSFIRVDGNFHDLLLYGLMREEY